MLSDGTLHFYCDFGILVPNQNQFAPIKDENKTPVFKMKIDQIDTDLE